MLNLSQSLLLISSMLEKEGKPTLAHDVESAVERITELELSRKELIEEFAEAECMGDLAKIARNYGYQEQSEWLT